MQLFDLSGEVAVVIGATGELGGAIAEGLAQAGATIAVLGRNAERGAARVKKITELGAKAAFVSADAVKRESLRAARVTRVARCSDRSKPRRPVRQRAKLRSAQTSLVDVAVRLARVVDQR